MQRYLVFISLFSITLPCAFAQTTSFDLKVGLREERTLESGMNGNIQNSSQARPMIGLEIIKNTKNNLSFPLGLFLQNYASRTLIEGFDMGATLNSHWFLGLSGGIERFFLKEKKIHVSVSLNQQILVVPNAKDKTFIGYYPEGVSPENAIKSESMRAIRAVNPISQIGAKIWFPIQKNTGIYVGYAYNIGWGPLFEREVNYTIKPTSGAIMSGRGIFGTQGSGLQANVGIRLNMPTI